MSEKDFYYGLLKYSSINIGDEIQSIAALRFLPSIDKLVHRESISKYRADKKTKLIMNAWWMWRPNFFPPSKDIEPLLISMYINTDIRNKFLQDKTKKYLIENGPVGCRDKFTAEYLNNNGIPAYFSGCLTLTLQRNPKLKRKDYILTVDLPEIIVNEIKKRTNRPVYSLSRMLLPNKTEKRMNVAKSMLYLYQSAHCVVSSRLHVCMPSLALETPVLMIETNDKLLSNDGRYEGLKNLCNHISEDDFMKNPNIYDFEIPPSNPTSYLEIRNDLIARCKDFTGYDSKKSSLEDIENEDFIIMNLLNSMRYVYNDYAKYIQWFIKPYDLLKTFFRKSILRLSKHDIIEKNY